MEVCRLRLADDVTLDRTEAFFVIFPVLRVFVFILSPHPFLTLCQSSSTATVEREGAAGQKINVLEEEVSATRKFAADHGLASPSLCLFTCAPKTHSIALVWL
jgi:hypothetical protein